MKETNGHLTAMARQEPSRPAMWLKRKHLLKGRLLDFGCGLGFDAQFFAMDKYDPHYHDVQIVGPYDTITCTYVLNVVPPQERPDVLSAIQALLAPSGSAYITVRRDLDHVFTAYDDGAKQWLVKLDLPIVFEDSAMCVYRLDCV